MKKGIMTTLLISLLMDSQSAYAVFEFIAEVESFLQSVNEIENKVNEVQKKIRDVEMRVRQGYELATSCFRDPGQCVTSQLNGFLTGDWLGEVKKHKDMIFTMKNSIMNTKKDVVNIKQKALLEDIEKKYTYDRGKGKDLEKLSKNRKAVNKIIVQEISLLFTKGASLHNAIQKEDDQQYNCDFSNNNMDELLHAQDEITVMTAARLAHILEMRSNIISAPATAEMTVQNQSTTQKKSQ